MTDHTTLLITLSGRDRPGLTAAVFDALTGDVLDVGQSTLQGRLVQLVLLRISPDEVALLTRSLQATAADLDLDVDISVSDESASRHLAPRNRVTILAAPLEPRHVAAVSRAIADAGANIERIDRIAQYPVTAVELVTRGPLSSGYDRR